MEEKFAVENLQTTDEKNEVLFATFAFSKKVLEENFREHIEAINKEYFDRLLNPDYIKVKCHYYKEFFDLDISEERLKVIHLELKESIIQKRLVLMHSYLEKHLEDMTVNAGLSFMEEAFQSVADGNSSLREHPKLGNVIPDLPPPDMKDVKEALLEPYRMQLATRLGFGPGKNSRRRTVQNFHDGIVPLFRSYWKCIKLLKQDLEGSAKPQFGSPIDEMLIAEAKIDGEPHLQACTVLLKAHELPYKNEETLYKLIHAETKEEEQLIQSLKKLN